MPTSDASGICQEMPYERTNVPTNERTDVDPASNLRDDAPSSLKHVRGPQRMTRLEAIAAIRVRLAAVNAERKAKP